jgi:undecaprenyl-diphosphatase
VRVADRSEWIALAVRGRITVMPNASSASATSSPERSARRDARVPLAAALLVLLATCFAATLLLVEVRWAPLLRADQGARDGLHNYALGHSGFVTAMQVISALGSAVAWVVVLTPVVAWLLWRGRGGLALFVAVGALGSSLLNVVVKTGVHRLRPVLPDPVARAHGLSFPSAHAQGAIVGAALLLLVFLPLLGGAWRKGAVIVAVVAVLAIGFSRIALGVHYVSDVLGGYFLGAAWVAALVVAFNVLATQRARRAALTSGRSPGKPFDSAPGR